MHNGRPGSLHPARPAAALQCSQSERMPREDAIRLRHGATSGIFEVRTMMSTRVSISTVSLFQQSTFSVEASVCLHQRMFSEFSDSHFIVVYGHDYVYILCLFRLWFVQYAMLSVARSLVNGGRFWNIIDVTTLLFDMLFNRYQSETRDVVCMIVEKRILCWDCRSTFIIHWCLCFVVCIYYVSDPSTVDDWMSLLDTFISCDWLMLVVCCRSILMMANYFNEIHPQSACWSIPLHQAINQQIPQAYYTQSAAPYKIQWNMFRLEEHV